MIGTIIGIFFLFIIVMLVMFIIGAMLAVGEAAKNIAAQQARQNTNRIQY